jgi:MFS family permease
VAAPMSMALSWLTLCMLSGYPDLMLATALAGIALGCALPTVTAIVAAHYGAERFGAVMGACYFLILSFSIGAVRVSGFVFDRTGGYQTSFEIFASLLGALFVVTALFALRQRAS